MNKETEERIKADAEAHAKIVEERLKGRNVEYGRMVSQVHGYTSGYIAGATAEHDKAQVLVDALEAAYRLKNLWLYTGDVAPEHEGEAQALSEMASQIETAIEQWKGKEVEPVKEIEYMPIHPDDAKKFDCPTQFPMHLLDEAQAQRNHGQSLKRLKERGGLNVREILAIVSKQPWGYYAELPWNKAIKMLNDIVITNPQK